MTAPLSSETARAPSAPERTAGDASGDGPAAVRTAPAASAAQAATAPAAPSASVIPLGRDEPLIEVAPIEVRPADASTAGGTAAPPTQAAGPSSVDAAPHGDLWARIRAGFAMPELPTPLVAQKERFYLARPDALRAMLARGAPYLHFIVEELEKRGMPTELALLPFVESAMNPIAESHAKAAGLWQFIPATGRRFDLSQDWWVDERRDVVRSTRAALAYLEAIHAMHGRDWFLALASYNWGENAVARAVRQNRARGRPTGYLDLRMPTETRHYVPKLIALKHIVQDPGRFGLALPEVPDRPYFASITKTRPIDLQLAARFAGMDVDAFLALNPSHNRPVIAASGSNRIRLPVDRVDAFARAMARHVRSGRPLASWQPHTLAPGESVATLARRAGIPVGELLRANGLGARSRVMPGSRLLVPQAVVRDEMLVRSFDGPRVVQAISLPPVRAVVRRGESLSRFARRHGVSTAELRRWNGRAVRARAGARLVVRPAMTRTVVTTADGRTEAVVRVGRPAAARARPGAASGAKRAPSRTARRDAAPKTRVETVRTPRRPATVARPRT